MRRLARTLSSDAVEVHLFHAILPQSYRARHVTNCNMQVFSMCFRQLVVVSREKAPVSTFGPYSHAWTAACHPLEAGATTSIKLQWHSICLSGPRTACRVCSSAPCLSRRKLGTALPTLGLRGKVMQHCRCDGRPVGRRCASAELVEGDEAAGRSPIQRSSCLCQLHEESRLHERFVLSISFCCQSSRQFDAPLPGQIRWSHVHPS